MCENYCIITINLFKEHPGFSYSIPFSLTDKPLAIIQISMLLTYDFAKFELNHYHKSPHSFLDPCNE